MEKRLNNITYKFPKSSESTTEIFKYLIKIFGNFPNTSCQTDIFSFTPFGKKEYMPITNFVLDNIDKPQVEFDLREDFSLVVGNLLVGAHINNLTRNNGKQKPEEKTTVLKDKNGEYLKIDVDNLTHYSLSMKEFYRRFNPYLFNLDHSGVIVPPTKIKESDWKDVANKLAKESNLYSYPNDFLTTFMLPSNDTEWKDEIKDFLPDRKPKFEFRYNKDISIPVIDLDFNSTLSKEELEKLLPEPYGFVLPGLEHWVRLVNIYSSWDDIFLVIAVRVKYTNGPGRWSSGKFLLDEGKRIIG